MALTIRAAIPDDVGLIRGLIRELAEYERAPEQAVATDADLVASLFGTDGARAAECLIAEWQGKPAGFAVFFHNFSTWTGTRGLYLEDLFVRPDARRLGIGRALLARLAAIAIDRGCTRFEWAVLDWNQPAIEFYQSLGAAPMTEWTVFRMTGAPLRALAASDQR